VNRFAVKLERFIAAPRAKVYRAFLDPAVLAQWFCPEGSSVVVADVDERVGGVHRIEMLSDEGVHHMFDSVIEQLVPDERIVLTFKFHPEGEETLFTVSFRDVDGGTNREPWPNAEDLRRRDRLQHRLLLERRPGLRSRTSH